MELLDYCLIVLKEKNPIHKVKIYDAKTRGFRAWSIIGLKHRVL